MMVGKSILRPSGLAGATVLELGGHGSAVNAVCPNYVTTGLGAMQNEYFSKLLGFDTVEAYVANMSTKNPMVPWTSARHSRRGDRGMEPVGELGIPIKSPIRKHANESNYLYGITCHMDDYSGDVPFRDVRQHDDIWVTTGQDIASHFAKGEQA